MNRIRAILWAQWRSSRNFFPRVGIAWSAIIGVIWYGLWFFGAVLVARVVADPEELNLLRVALPGGLLLAGLYWQFVPLLTASTGASLELRKLQVYPIPVPHLFLIEALLRTTAAIEMVLILSGLAVGILFNPALPKLGALAVVPYMLFNLALAVGIRDIATRLLARKRIREIVFFILILSAALPQLFVSRGSRVVGTLRILLSGNSWKASPWTAASNLILGADVASAIGWLVLWCAVALAFGLWQFSRTLSFDAQAAAASPVRAGGRRGLLEGLYKLPSVWLPDPLGALVEKEVRFLARSPRFRMVFLMGFTFGLVIWLPMAFGRNTGSNAFMGGNYLTVVSVYSLLLLSEVCFWNSFGFDRSAAQVYFLAPVPFSRVLIGKNLSAAIFVTLEILAVTAVCGLLRMPLSPMKLAEAFAVAGVISIFLMAAGNMMSVRQARGVNPDSSFRRGAAGRVQAILFVVYPIAFLPAGLAYLARYAFDSELAFFGVLAFDALVGLVVYRIALESAVHSAEALKEKMIGNLSAGEGPIAG